MHRLLISCAAVLVMIGWGRAAEPVDTTASIAAWNIKAKPDPIDAVRAKEIARGIDVLDAEVVAVCEIKPPEAMLEIMAELSRLGCDYRLQYPQQVSELQLALLHKPGVEVSAVRMIDEINLGDPEIRKALTANVRIGKFDFHLVSVHFKSGGETAQLGLRARQSEIMARYLEQATCGSEKDVLLVGDYNMPPTRDVETYRKLDPNGRLRFVSVEDLSRLGSHIHEGRYGNLLDGFAVSRDHTREYIDGTLRIFPMNKALGHSLSEYGRRVSDHLPLTARFRITVDDD